MRHIAVVSGSRADWGYYVPILDRIGRRRDLRLSLIVTGAHLERAFGLTHRDIQRDGFKIAARIRSLKPASTPLSIAQSIGIAVSGLAQAYERLRPDIVLLLGDRFEMLAAAAALLPFAIPMAHIAGGESTEGAMDESIRNALTKMSHLHFVANARFRRRVIQMGEDPWRVTVTGAPTLDNLRRTKLPGRGVLEEMLDLPFDPAPLVVTFHPETLAYRQTQAHVRELLGALETTAGPIIFTAPNADTSRHSVAVALRGFVARRADARLVTNLGTAAYFSLMKHAQAMVGNSSSGIIEAASFGLPVVNVGRRQRGRLHGRNVLDVPCESSAIARALRRATSPAFRRSVSTMKNPYGDGHAAARIVSVLRRVPLDERLLIKRFRDVGADR